MCCLLACWVESGKRSQSNFQPGAITPRLVRHNRGDHSRGLSRYRRRLPLLLPQRIILFPADGDPIPPEVLKGIEKQMPAACENSKGTITYARAGGRYAMDFEAIE
jgi:hypothetical protein